MRSRGFYERIRSRRSRQIALVAVARKLAVLAWHFLSDDADYRWASATLTADTRRLVERKAGLLTQPASRSSAVSKTTRRDQERRIQHQAEEAYRAMVAARHAERDAAASNGERLESARPDARQRSPPQPPLFPTRIDRVTVQANPRTMAALDIFIHTKKVVGGPGFEPGASRSRTLRRPSQKVGQARSQLVKKLDAVRVRLSSAILSSGASGSL